METINHIEVRDGTGYIRGRNIKAELVARQHLMERSSIEEVATQYDLSPAEVYSAIAFYYDNQAELDVGYAQALELAKEVGLSVEDFKARIKARQESDFE